VAESCDGSGDDCPADGYVASDASCADDGNICTTDTCDGAGSCVHPAGNAGTVCRDHCIRNGLMLRATRDTMLISPPLTWTRAHIDEFMTIVKKGLDLTLADSRKW